MSETETIDRLFLELSQFTSATTKKELEKDKEIERLREALRKISKIGPRFEAKGTSTTKMVTIARRALEE